MNKVMNKAIKLAQKLEVLAFFIGYGAFSSKLRFLCGLF